MCLVNRFSAILNRCPQNISVRFLIDSTRRSFSWFTYFLPHNLYRPTKIFRHIILRRGIFLLASWFLVALPFQLFEGTHFKWIIGSNHCIVASEFSFIQDSFFLYWVWLLWEAEVIFFRVLLLISFVNFYHHIFSDVAEAIVSFSLILLLL